MRIPLEADSEDIVIFNARLPSSTAIEKVLTNQAVNLNIFRELLTLSDKEKDLTIDNEDVECVLVELTTPAVGRECFKKHPALKKQRLVGTTVYSEAVIGGNHPFFE